MNNYKDRYNKDFFSFGEYINKPRWNSYFHQIEETVNLGKTALVIGVGDGIVPYALMRMGLTVYTFDFSEELKPDFLGSVHEIQAVLPPDFMVDVIVCCQVLEHLEYKYFESILAQFKKIAMRSVVLSLPCHYWNFIRIGIKFRKFED